MKKTYIFAGTAILFWSTIAVVAKLLLGTLNNMQLLWASSFFAGIFLLFVNIVTGNIRSFKQYKAKDYAVMALIGLPGTFLYYVFYYGGADILPASQAFIINYLWPIMSVVFACILLKEKMTVRKGIAIAISFLGVAVVTSGDLMQFNTTTLYGALLCVCGAVSYGLFTALNQKIYYDKRISMMINFAVTFVLSTIINGINGNLFIPNLAQTAGFVWNGIFTMAVSSVLWAMALESRNTAKISNLAYITPFLSLMWTFLILKEPLTVYSVAGLVIIVLGILIQLQPNKGQKC